MHEYLLKVVGHVGLAALLVGDELGEPALMGRCRGHGLLLLNSRQINGLEALADIDFVRGSSQVRAQDAPVPSGDECI
jgi:hypothetical protein